MLTACEVDVADDTTLAEGAVVALLVVTELEDAGPATGFETGLKGFLSFVMTLLGTVTGFED